MESELNSDTNESSEQVLVCSQMVPQSATVAEPIVENNDTPSDSDRVYQIFLNTLGLKEIPLILNGIYFKIKNVDCNGIIIKCECQICLHPRILSASVSCTSNLITHLKVS